MHNRNKELKNGRTFELCSDQRFQKQQGSYDLSLDDNIGIQALVYNHVVKYRISFK